MTDNNTNNASDDKNGHIPIVGNTAKDYFYNGLYCLYNGNLNEAKIFFIKIIKMGESSYPYFCKSMSFLGVTEVFLHQSNGGLHRCYDALHDCTEDQDLYVNIAYAEYYLGNRKRSVKALETCLAKEPAHIHANTFFKFIGKRSTSRSSLLNCTLGKFLRKPIEKCHKEFMDIIKKDLFSKLNLFVTKKNSVFRLRKM